MLVGPSRTCNFFGTACQWVKCQHCNHQIWPKNIVNIFVFFFFEKSSFEVHRSRMTFGYSWVNRPLFYLTIVDYRMMFRFLLFRLLGERQMSYYLETHSLALTELFWDVFEVDELVKEEVKEEVGMNQPPHHFSIIHARIHWFIPMFWGGSASRRRDGCHFLHIWGVEVRSSRAPGESVKCV